MGIKLDYSQYRTVKKFIEYIFNISIDELLDNEIKDVLVSKVSNTEKLSGMIIKILKVIGILIIISIILTIITFLLFSVDPGKTHVEENNIEEVKE